MKEGLTDLEIIDDASPDHKGFSNEEFLNYCSENNILLKRNSKNLGIIKNHYSIGSRLRKNLLFLINDDDNIQKSELSKIHLNVKKKPSRYFLRIIESIDDKFNEIHFYSLKLNSSSRFVRTCSFLFYQHDWLLHGVLYGDDLVRFSGFLLYPDRPDMFGRIITFDVLLRDSIKQIDVPYVYSGDSKKHYKKKTLLYLDFLFIAVRLAEVHAYYFFRSIKNGALITSFIVPIALIYSWVMLILRAFKFIVRRFI